MKPITILDKFLIYKNIKITLLITYPILALIVYLNWDKLDDLWFNYLIKINQNFEEPISIILIFSYCFYSFYFVLFLFYPLFILDKKYENNDRIKINFNKEHATNSLKNILLFIASPILLLVGGIISIGFLLIADIAIDIWFLSGLILIAILTLCISIFYIYKVLKKHYDTYLKKNY